MDSQSADTIKGVAVALAAIGGIFGFSAYIVKKSERKFQNLIEKSDEFIDDYRKKHEQDLDYARKRILTVSLDQYAQNQKRSPSDYDMMNVSSVGSAPLRHAYFAEEVALISLLEKMKKEGLEAVVSAQFNESPGYVNIHGTGVKLKSV